MENHHQKKDKKIDLKLSTVEKILNSYLLYIDSLNKEDFENEIKFLDKLAKREINE